ncbi:hypothetical protein AYO50_01775 [Acidobacteria bacterium SCGC AG-212-P17]|nr:hypothetical protein AYO50_01775 [Acidobacteria bacterium SCGC AG-212-P17]
MNRPVTLKLATPASKLHHEALSALSANLSVASGRLQDLIALMKIVFSDENFITALEAEGLITIPTCLVKHLGEKTFCHLQE